MTWHHPSIKHFPATTHSTTRLFDARGVCDDIRGRRKQMTINDLPAIMGTIVIVVGLALVGIYTRARSATSERSVQAGALLVVVGAVLLGLSLFVHQAR